MSIDVSNVKGGEYELVAALFDQVTSKPGEPFDFKRYRAGDLVTLDVEEAKRLTLAGAIVVPGSRQKAQAEALRVQYEAALAALPDEVRQEVLATQAGPSVDGASAPETDEPGEAVQPPKGASKDDWVNYAVALDWDREAAEKLTKRALQDAILSDSGDDAPPVLGGAEGATDGGDAAGDTESESADNDEDEVPPLPATIATHEAWVEAAVLRGIPQSEAEQLTQPELVNLLT